MKQVLTKEMVAKAMADIKAIGGKATLAALHAALDHRGSLTTLIKLKAELEAPAQSVTDSQEGLKAFRELWELAREEGREMEAAAMAELKKDREVLMQENERLEGAAAAAASQIAESTQTKARIEAELGRAQALLAQSQEAVILAKSATNAEQDKLAAEQTSHMATKQEVLKYIQQYHDLELELVKYKTLLEPQSALPRNNRVVA